MMISAAIDWHIDKKLLPLCVHITHPLLRGMLRRDSGSARAFGHGSAAGGGRHKERAWLQGEGKDREDERGGGF